MSSQGRGDRAVKIVIINTKYVETDAMSFKDVVQKLTGKDSKVAYETQEPPPAKDTSTSSRYSDVREDRDEGLSNGVRSSSTNSHHSNNPVEFMTSSTRSNSSVMMRNISFKEFERLFREMPPTEEFWTTDY